MIFSSGQDCAVSSYGELASGVKRAAKQKKGLTIISNRRGAVLAALSCEDA